MLKRVPEKECILVSSLPPHRKYAIVLYKSDKLVRTSMNSLIERLEKGRMIAWKYMNLLKII